jgi:hypothetical protein
MCKNSNPQMLEAVTYSDVSRYSKNVKPFGINAIDESGTPYLHYKLPRTDILEGKSVRHYFNAEVDGDAAADDAFHDNIKSIWRSIRVQVGSEDIQHVLQFGHLSVILDNLHYSTDKRAGYGAVAQGIPALSSSGTAVRYGHCLLPDGFLDHLLPLYKLSQVEVILELNQTLNEHTNATTAVTELDVTSPQLKCTMIRSAQLRQKMDAGDYEISFTDYDLFEDTSLLSGASSHTVVVPSSQRSVTGIVMTMRNTADVNDPNWGAGKYQVAYLKNGLTKLHFIIDGEQVPKESINCNEAVELYDYLHEFAGGEHKVGPYFQGAYDTDVDGRFVLFFPFSGNPFNENDVTGIDLASKTGQIQIELTQMTATANTQVRGWVRYQRVARISSDGKVVVSK